MTESAPTAPEEPPGRPMARLLGTILAAGLVNGALASGRLILPLVALALGAGSAMVGVVAAMFTVAPIAMNVRFGRWVDRSGSWRPFVLSAALIVLAGVLFEVLATVWILPFVAGLIGAGAVFGHVAATRAVSEIGPRSQRARNIGFLVVGYSLFQFLMPLIAGVTYEAFGARTALAGMGALGLLAIFWLATGLHGFARGAAIRAPETPGLPQRSLVFHAGLLPRIAVSATFSSVQTIYPFVVSLLCVAVGLTAAHAALLLGAFALGTVASRLCLGLVTRRVPFRMALWAALLTGGGLYAFLPLLTGFGPLLLVSGLLGLPVGLGVPLSMTLIYDAAPEGRANEAMGLTMTVTNVMQAATPLLMGVAASGLGVGLMIWSLSALMLGAALVNRW